MLIVKCSWDGVMCRGLGKAGWAEITKLLQHADFYHATFLEAVLLRQESSPNK